MRAFVVVEAPPVVELRLEFPLIGGSGLADQPTFRGLVRPFEFPARLRVRRTRASSAQAEAHAPEAQHFVREVVSAMSASVRDDPCREEHDDDESEQDHGRTEGASRRYLLGTVART